MPRFRIRQSSTLKSPVYYTPLDIDEDVLRQLYPGLSADPQAAGHELAQFAALMQNLYDVAADGVRSEEDPRGHAREEDYEWQVEYIEDDEDTSKDEICGPAVAIEEPKVREAAINSRGHEDEVVEGGVVASGKIIDHTLVAAGKQCGVCGRLLASTPCPEHGKGLRAFEELEE